MLRNHHSPDLSSYYLSHISILTDTSSLLQPPLIAVVPNPWVTAQNWIANDLHSDEDDGELCLQRVIGPVDSKQRCSGILRDNMSSCMLPAQQKPLNPPGPFCKGKNTGDEECEDEEFESVLNRELEATFHVIEADAGLKERKNRQESSNDDLFYDPHMDDADQKWIDKCRRKYLRKSQSSSKNGGNDEKSMKLPHSDAILNCPCCMSMLCLDCQRHELYSGQYRAMFVFNCIVDFDQTLLYPKKGTKKRKRGKECALGMQAALDGDLSENELDMRKLVSWQNKKKKKSGGFQSMGLSHAVFKGIMRKGYKVPTPIQRKCIPVIMDGRDMVGMARTGSGKTAAFLIPMLEKLQVHSASTGARALILSPTRELALQTLKFTKELGRFTGLKAAVIVGGESMEDQFAALHENPDIILATPGRLCHVCIEMSLKLTSIHYVVFDEADRLFEMGFQEQLHEILRRLPENRQTLLFSATLPKLLVDFAKAGLSDPVLIRLDVESKLSEQLKLAFFSVRAEDKLALLLHLLRNVIPTDQLTVIFMATKHYVDYLNLQGHSPAKIIKELKLPRSTVYKAIARYKELGTTQDLVLEKAGVPRTYLYSSLDPTARKINAAKFSSRKVNLLIVTDIAARGIDIPLLDNVINFDFPSKPKLFVHRVGELLWFLHALIIPILVFHPEG
ncbi:unnamed protein product, partial [Darwinula stevensoni]